jgi:translation initiation factor IF-1
VLPHSVYRVGLANGHRVLGHCSARDKKNFGELAVGDGVLLEMSPFDLSRGRIIGNRKET